MRSAVSLMPRLIFSAAARATISGRLAPASTLSVSKKASLLGTKPSLRRPAASTAARRRADRDVGAEFAGRGDQRQCQQIGGNNRERALGLQGGDRGPEVAQRAR